MQPQRPLKEGLTGPFSASQGRTREDGSREVSDVITGWKGAMIKARGQPLEAGKSKEVGSSLEPCEAMLP